LDNEQSKALLAALQQELCCIQGMFDFGHWRFPSSYIDKVHLELESHFWVCTWFGYSWATEENYLQDQSWLYAIQTMRWINFFATFMTLVSLVWFVLVEIAKTKL
jgi:hypothetical protein